MRFTKNNWIARGFAREYVRSCTGYEPGRSVKDSASLVVGTLKKLFCLERVGFLLVTS